MTSQITIRSLEDSEWPIYSALRLEALEDSPKMFGGNLDIEGKYTSREWMDWLKPYRQVLFGLFDGDKPIGLTALMTDRENPSIGHFIASYIKPEYRGRGLTRMLYNARTEWAVKNPAWNKVVTCHREGNEASRRANQRHGFILVKCAPETWPDGTVDNKYDYELNLEELRRKKLEMASGLKLHHHQNGG